MRRSAIAIKSLIVFVAAALPSVFSKVTINSNFGSPPVLAAGKSLPISWGGVPDSGANTCNVELGSVSGPSNQLVVSVGNLCANVNPADDKCDSTIPATATPGLYALIMDCQGEKSYTSSFTVTAANGGSGSGPNPPPSGNGTVPSMPPGNGGDGTAPNEPSKNGGCGLDGICTVWVTATFTPTCQPTGGNPY